MLYVRTSMCFEMSAHANQCESCCGKSVREIKREKAETKRASTELWITKFSALWLFINLKTQPLTVFILCFTVSPLYASLSQHIQPSFASMPTGAMATRHWLQQGLGMRINLFVFVSVSLWIIIHTSICMEYGPSIPSKNKINQPQKLEDTLTNYES